MGADPPPGPRGSAPAWKGPSDPAGRGADVVQDGGDAHGLDFLARQLEPEREVPGELRRVETVGTEGGSAAFHRGQDFGGPPTGRRDGTARAAAPPADGSRASGPPAGCRSVPVSVKGLVLHAEQQEQVLAAALLQEHHRKIGAKHAAKRVLVHPLRLGEDPQVLLVAAGDVVRSRARGPAAVSSGERGQPAVGQGWGAVPGARPSHRATAPERHDGTEQGGRPPRRRSAVREGTSRGGARPSPAGPCPRAAAGRAGPGHGRNRRPGGRAQGGPRHRRRTPPAEGRAWGSFGARGGKHGIGTGHRAREWRGLPRGPAGGRARAPGPARLGGPPGRIPGQRGDGTRGARG